MTPHPEDETRRKRRSATCPECFNTVRVFVPAKGDGSRDVYANHKRLSKSKDYCRGSRRFVPLEYAND